MKPFAWTVAVLLVFAAPVPAQRTSVGRDFPIYDNDGYPDLTVDPQRFVSQMEIVDRLFDPVDDECAFEEGVIGGAGYRRILRFDTVIINAGNGDLVVGDRSDPNNPYAGIFYFDPCHGHYHMKGFSEYRVLYQDGNVAATGHKQGFCFEDSFKFTDHPSNGYHCGYQGITSGWGDWYYKQLVGQWIDVTGVPEGEYQLEVEINIQDPAYRFDEGQNKYPNTTRTPATIPKRRER